MEPASPPGACRRDSRGVFFGGFAAGTPAAPPPPGAPAAVGLVTRDNENANNPHDFNVLEDSPFGSVPANPPQPVSKPHPPQFHVATVAVLLLQSTIVAVTAVTVLLFFVL